MATLSVAEEQNLTRAAQRLFVSQPTLTVHLNRLEAQLGVKLFDRTASPIRVTGAGRYYIEKMKQLASEEQSMRSRLQGIAHPAQTLIVGIGQVRGHHWMPGVLEQFCKEFPDVNIQLVQMPEKNICDALQQGRMDVVIGVLSNLWEELSGVELLRERLFLAAVPELGLLPENVADNSPENPFLLEPSLFNGMPFIVPGVGNGMFSSYETMLRVNHFHPGRVIAVNNLNTGLQMTRKGLGVQLLSGSILDMNPDLQPGQLHYFRLPDMPEPRKCVAAYYKESIKEPLIGAFLEIVQEIIPECCSCVDFASK